VQGPAPYRLQAAASYRFAAVFDRAPPAIPSAHSQNDRARLEALLEPRAYVGESGAIVDWVLVLVP